MSCRPAATLLSPVEGLVLDLLGVGSTWWWWSSTPRHVFVGSSLTILVPVTSSVLTVSIYIVGTLVSRVLVFHICDNCPSSPEAVLKAAIGSDS